MDKLKQYLEKDGIGVEILDEKTLVCNNDWKVLIDEKVVRNAKTNIQEKYETSKQLSKITKG